MEKTAANKRRKAAKWSFYSRTFLEPVGTLKLFTGVECRTGERAGEFEQSLLFLDSKLSFYDPLFTVYSN